MSAQRDKPAAFGPALDPGEDPLAGEDEPWADDDFVVRETRALEASITELSLAVDRLERFLDQLLEWRPTETRSR